MLIDREAILKLVAVYFVLTIYRFHSFQYVERERDLLAYLL